ncbi:AAA family ATPase [Anaerobutyricum hallii]|uniref:AAA family ATPase n=1 Tax=Anaerobutyricum hallii TaxID=39488 RepID=UPI003AB1DEA4
MDNSTITTISIRNFKGIEDLQLNAKKLNAIIGKCGSGKSSLLDAIRFALTGKAGKEVIRKGCREASVVLRFSDNSTIERIRRTSENISKCNGKSSTKRSLDEFLTARNMNPCWIESLCSVDWFAGLSSKDLNNFFMTILPLRAKAETVVELVAQLDKDLTEKKEKYLMEEILKKQEIFSFNDLANGYNTAYTVRQELKRKYNEMLPRCTFNETVPAKTREDIEKELNNISQVEAAEKEYSKRLKEYTSSKKQHDLAIKRLDEMKKELDTYSSCKKPKEETKTQAEADRKLFQVHIKRTNEYIGTINSTLDLLKRTLDNLDKPICPISEKLICTTDKSQLKEELLSLIQKNENALASNKEFLAKCEDQVRKRDDIISNYQKEVYRYEQKTTLENNISKFIVPEILPEPQKVEKAHLEAKKKELLDLLSILSRYEKVQQNKKELAKIKDKYDLAQFAVKVLDSKIGIPALILQRTLRFFEKKCNEKASLLREGFQIHFLSDNGITIQVSPGKGKPFVDMKEVSTGEFVCVAYILMTMIGEATKCHLFLIDNLDRLDTEYLNALLSLLEEDKKIEQVFLGGVDHADVERTLNDKSFQIIHM